MRQGFTIYDRLPGMNEFIEANRKNPKAGARMKRESQWDVQAAISVARLKPVKSRCRIHYTFFEPNRRRDMDNVAGFAHKVIQDALVETGILENDGWRNISGFIDDFYVDKENPRIEVTIIYQGAEQ